MDEALRAEQRRYDGPAVTAEPDPRWLNQPMRQMTPGEIRTDELKNLLGFIQTEDLGPRGIARAIEDRIDSLRPEQPRDPEPPEDPGQPVALADIIGKLAELRAEMRDSEIDRTILHAADMAMALLTRELDTPLDRRLLDRQSLEILASSLTAGLADLLTSGVEVREAEEPG